MDPILVKTKKNNPIMVKKPYFLLKRKSLTLTKIKQNKNYSENKTFFTMQYNQLNSSQQFQH